MAENTAIEWADHTFNPWIGCTKVSPACEHCYAWAMMDQRYGRVRWGAGEPRIRTSEANWKLPIAWDRKAAAEGRRYRVFCASLADVFDNEVNPDWRSDLFELINRTPNLDWLLLTKRIGNVERMIWADGEMKVMPPNVLLGATIANQDEADRDIPKLKVLKQAGIVGRTFLSIEPLLGPVDFGAHLLWQDCENWLDEDGYAPITDPSTGMQECCRKCDFTGIGDELAIDWVIVGGESGAGARPMHPDWVRSLRDQCAGAGIPFFFKQWGAHSLEYDRERDDPDWRRCSDQQRRPGQWLNLAGGTGFHGERVHYAARLRKKAAGRLLDGVQHDGFPNNAA